MRFAAPDDALGLVPEEAGRADGLLELRPVGRGEGGGRRVLGEQGGRDLVDPLVGALGGQDRGHEDLERVPELEGRPAVGEFPAQDGDDRRDALRRRLSSASSLEPKFVPQLELSQDVGPADDADELPGRP